MTYAYPYYLYSTPLKPEPTLGYDPEIVPSISDPYNPISSQVADFHKVSPQKFDRTFLCEGLFALCSFP
jgi:hypothetical protein